MDFGKFRVGGELSDIEVVVDNKHFQLHRFPLYTRSNFFLKEFAKLGSQQAIDLNKFPVGFKAFTMIADFCYNISVEITVENVIEIRCGAKYLEMYGSGNLYEKTGLLIEAIAGNARRGKDVEKLIYLISTIPPFQTDDTTTHTFEQCTSALVHYWNKSQYGLIIIDEIKKPEIQSLFFEMPFDYFIKVMQACKKRIENPEVLNVLVSDYILHILNSHSTTTSSAETDSPEDSGTETHTDEESDHGSLTNGQLSSGKQQASGEKGNVIFDKMSLEKIQRLLDSIRPTFTSQTVPSKWLKPLLEAYSTVDGSDDVLGTIAASMVNHMDDECLSMMNEQTLASFAEKVEADGLSEVTKDLIIEHLVRQVDSGQLSASGFKDISTKLALHDTTHQDNLLYIIGELNKKEDGFKEGELMDCLSMIEMRRCSIKALRHAQISGGIPAEVVLSAALDICDSLQERVDASSNVIQEQEKEISALSLQRFGVLRVDTSPQRNVKGRAASHSSLYNSPTRSDVGSSRNSESPTAGLGRALDGIWSDRANTLPNNQEANMKLSELLRKQRQNNKLWK